MLQNKLKRIVTKIHKSTFSKPMQPSQPDQISLGLQTSHPSPAYIHHRQTTQDLSRFQIKSLDPTIVGFRSVERKNFINTHT